MNWKGDEKTLRSENRVRKMISWQTSMPQATSVNQKGMKTNYDNKKRASPGQVRVTFTCTRNCVSFRLWNVSKTFNKYFQAIQTLNMFASLSMLLKFGCIKLLIIGNRGVNCNKRICFINKALCFFSLLVL